MDSTLESIARLASRISGGDGCLIHLLDRKQNLLKAVFLYRVGQEFADPLKPGQGIPGMAFRQKKPLSVSDLREGSSGPWREASQKEGFRAATSLPLRGRRRALGTITFFRRSSRPSGGAGLPLLGALADQAAVALENAAFYEKLRDQLAEVSRERKKEGQTKTFLENIVDRSVDPILATDLHGKFTFVSRGAEEMFGLPKQELLGKKISRFYAGGDREARKIMKVLAKREKLRNYETEFIGPAESSSPSSSPPPPQGRPGQSRGNPGSEPGNHRVQKPPQPYHPDGAELPEALRCGQRRHLLPEPGRILQHLQPHVPENDRVYGKRDAEFPFFPDHPPRRPPHDAQRPRKGPAGDYAPERYTFRLINKEEKVIYVEGNFRRLKEKNEVLGVLAVLRDVTEKIRLEKELLELSITDGLTGLHNQRHFYNELDKEMERVKRQHTTLSLLLFDLDDFKVFNDIHGHLEGDKVLRSVAQVALKSIRRMDSAYRYGGDEFTVILPGAGKAEAAQVADRIRKSFTHTPYLQQIKLSIGLVEFDPSTT